MTMIPFRLSRRPSLPPSLLLLAALCTSLATAKPEKPIEVRYAAMALPPGHDKLVMVTEEIRSEAFEPPVNFLSEPLVVPARSFQIQKEDDTKSLAQVALPEQGNSFVVLLVPGEKILFEAVVIPARDGKFRPGHFYVHNVSSKSVIGQVGTTRFALPPRKGSVVRPEGAREERFYDVLLGVRENESNRVISSSRWPLSRQTRTYVFFYDNSKRGDVDFRAIDEFVPPEEPG